MSKGQLIYLEEVTTYQPLHDPKKHTLSVRLVCDLDSHVCVWLFFFFFLDQRLLHYLWDINNALRQMNSIL